MIRPLSEEDKERYNDLLRRLEGLRAALGEHVSAARRQEDELLRSIWETESRLQDFAATVARERELTQATIHQDGSVT